MKILSLCDGISCGYMAFNKAGIHIDKYYASEIKKEAIECSKMNFPDIIHIGDVKKISYQNGILHTEFGDYKEKFDIVIFGSPCQSFSRAMKKDKRIGLKDDMRSGVFLDCHRILKEVDPEFFLMENVIMNKNDESTITEMLGISPIRINSKLVSAQLRDRLYWTNIPVTIPNDLNIKLQDILTDGYTEKTKARCLMKNDSHGYYNGCNYNAPARFYREHYKSFSTIIYPDKEHYELCLKKATELLNGKKPKNEHFNTYKGSEFDCIRYLNKYERARLQTIPEKYIEHLSEKTAADLLGDGWTVDVIAHILKELKNKAGDVNGFD